MADYNIDTLQIKVLSDNWGTHKSKVLLEGEPLLILSDDIGISAPVFVLGDGTSTIEHLVNNNDVFVVSGSEGTAGSTYDLIASMMSSSMSSTTPEPITTEVTGDAGTSEKMSRADHRHSISGSTVDALLYGNGHSSNSNTYKKIRSGTSLPSSGTDGDIFILYQG